MREKQEPIQENLKFFRSEANLFIIEDKIYRSTSSTPRRRKKAKQYTIIEYVTGIKNQTHTHIHTYNTNLGKSLDEFFGADVREPLEFHVGQLLGEDRGRWAQLGDVHLKNTVDSSIRVRVWKKSGRHEIKCKWRATTFQRGVLRAMKGEPDSLHGIHEDKKRKRAEATHIAPFLSNFPPAAASAKFNRVLIFVAVSKWFPADRRRDALSHPRHSIKIRSA